MPFRRGTRVTDYLERGLPALILTVVAFTQLYLAHTSNLSPWKGGGFGMFAAVDAPAMRIIMAEGLDENGQRLRLDAYSALDDNTVRRIRSFPKPSDLEQLAPQLLGQSFVPSSIQRQAAYDQLQDESDRSELTQLDELDIEPFVNGPMTPSIGALYRLRTAYDPDRSDLTKTLTAVRLQWWRIRFARQPQRLYAEPLSPLIEAGTWN